MCSTKWDPCLLPGLPFCVHVLCVIWCHSLRTVALPSFPKRRQAWKAWHGRLEKTLWGGHPEKEKKKKSEAGRQWRLCDHVAILPFLPFSLSKRHLPSVPVSLPGSDLPPERAAVWPLLSLVSTSSIIHLLGRREKRKRQRKEEGQKKWEEGDDRRAGRRMVFFCLVAGKNEGTAEEEEWWSNLRQCGNMWRKRKRKIEKLVLAKSALLHR